MLLIRRLVYLGLFILSLVFISLYGGNVPYMLFFLIVVNTVVSVVYILYAFYRFRIYQKVAAHKVTKGDYVPFTLMVNNESIVTYRDVKLTFAEGLSKVKGTGQVKELALEPGCEITRELELCCNYSGTYFAGVDKIEIMDYFKIFRIKFNMPQKLKVTVEPRILKLDSIDRLIQAQELKNSSIRGENNVPDNQVREYMQGDNVKRIHWRNSAKAGKLMVRQYTAEEQEQYLVVLDTVIARDTYEDRIMAADRLRELLLAIVNHICESGYSARVVVNGFVTMDVYSKKEFNELFKKMVYYSFESGQKVDVSRLAHQAQGSSSCIFITDGYAGVNREDITGLALEKSIYTIDVAGFDKLEDIM